MFKKFLPALISLVLTPQAKAAPARTIVETVISSIGVQPINGGFNPDAFAYKITAQVLLGGNPCEAQGVTGSLKQSLVDGVVHVIPVKSIAPGPRPICGRNWRPVYKTVQTVVRNFQSRVSDVIIHNISQRGTLTSVRDLLDADFSYSNSTMTGTINRVAAIGGETTGFSLRSDSNVEIELDLATNNLDLNIDHFLGRSVRVEGVYRKIQGVETGERLVLEVSRIETAGSAAP